jgi:hypothetical protein
MQCFGQAKEHKAGAPIRRVFGSTTKKSFHSSKRVPVDQNSEAIRFRSGLNSSWPEIGNWPRLNRGKKPHSDKRTSQGLAAAAMCFEIGCCWLSSCDEPSEYPLRGSRSPVTSP